MKFTKDYWSKLYFVAFLVFITISNLFGQKFQITKDPVSAFNIDKVSNEIYYQIPYSNDTIKVVDLKSNSVRGNPELVDLPIWGNKNHFMLCRKIDKKSSIYLYDFRDSSYYFISDASSFAPYSAECFSFSPNDINFFAFGNGSYTLSTYLSMIDTTVKPVEINGSLDLSGYNDLSPKCVAPQWSSDSSIIFLSAADTMILEYYLESHRLDTLVNTADISSISGFDYNIKYSILAYSIKEDYSQDIHFYYNKNGKDSLAFSRQRDFPDNFPDWDCGDVALVSLTWSPDEQKLAFLAKQYIDAAYAGIYIYSLDSNNVYEVADCYDDDKVNIEWANNDTLIYYDFDDFLYGLNVTTIITSVENKQDNSISYNLELGNYPNPFNPSTTIIFTLTEKENIKLIVYNILGEEVIRLADDIIYEAGEHTIQFDASNFASGVYLYRLQTSTSTLTKKMMLLK